MKYMGSKKSMLSNGLGELLLHEVSSANNFFDPFCGSSSVAWFVAEKTKKKVFAGDLQKFSTDLANAILLRNKPMDVSDLRILETWVQKSEDYYNLVKVDLSFKSTKKFILENRRMGNSILFPITNSYGGYYFSIDQSLRIDSLLYFLPQKEPLRSVAITCVIEAASQCVAAPGHTAQPFQPIGEGLTALIDAWKRDPFYFVEKAILDFAFRHANEIGNAITGNALTLIDKVNEGDLVFLDPPYSGVHYSRFYHVLETISRYSWETVSGRGRYPSIENRPQSDFSLSGKSVSALNGLFQKLSFKKASAVVTFPSKKCSNGLSGEIVKELACKYFKISQSIIKGEFSTMGGNNSHRPARQLSEELVLILKCRRKSSR